MLVKAKDEYAIVLDFLPFGKGVERRGQPIAQLIGEKYFSLLEVGVKEGVTLKPFDRVYIGDQKREHVKFIKDRISYDELTSVAKSNLEAALEKIVSDERVVEFFNKAPPINPRMHSLELLRGIGKKTLMKIVAERSKKPFESIEDIVNRTSINNPKRLFIERVLDELSRKDRYNFIVGVEIK